MELLPGIFIVLIFFIAIVLMLAKSKGDDGNRKIVEWGIDRAGGSGAAQAAVNRAKSYSFDHMPSGSIERMIYTCYLEGKSPRAILNDPRLAEWRSKGKSFDKFIYIEYIGIQMIKEGLIESTHEGPRKDDTFKPIGNID